MCVCVYVRFNHLTRVRWTRVLLSHLYAPFFPSTRYFIKRLRPITPHTRRAYVLYSCTAVARVRTVIGASLRTFARIVKTRCRWAITIFFPSDGKTRRKRTPRGSPRRVRSVYRSTKFERVHFPRNPKNHRPLRLYRFSR